jgi:hypothetical protein
MNVGELKRAIEEAESILSAAKAPVKDLRTFLKIFEGREHEDIDVFFNELRSRLNAASSGSKATVAREPDQTVVQSYVDKLRAAVSSEPTFSGALTEMGADTRVQKEEIDLIAHTLTAGRTSWPSKAEAVKAIRDWFTDEAYQAAKSVQVDKGSPWTPPWGRRRA